ncbi:hypothetical protein IKQ19_06325 [Candidatus Saccharibacteria bacterium]|nr:hypothetical protein [Candidatus Saccharibacteria bacterium]
MRKLFALVTTTALLMVACGDDNSSSASDNDFSSSSEEASIESSSNETSVSSSSEKKDEPASSSSIQEASSSSSKDETLSQESSSSIQETSSSVSETESSSSTINESTYNFNDDELVIKQIPTFGELDGKPYFYTTEPRCTYKDGIFSTNPDLSEYAYFYDISNDTLTTSLIKLHDVFAGNYDDHKLRETYYGQSKSIEGKWNYLCYINLNDGYTQCSHNHQMIVTKDTIYSVYSFEQSKDEVIFHIAEQITQTSLGYFEEMSSIERSSKYAENGITIDSSGTKILISIKNKGTLSIDEIATKIINNNETIYRKIALSTDKKECVLTSESTPVKSSKYCSEEFLPYLQIDDFDGYVSTYAKGNQEEFDACLENLFN